MLKQLLYSDLCRQYELERCRCARPGFWALLRRLPHPRFLPIVLCRVSRAALLRRLPLLPGLCSYLNLLLFGLEATPRCEIGPGIFFPHPSGTVIGACRIGNNVTIFQGVTLGARQLDMGFDPGLRPEIGDNVVIGCGAKILGGNPHRRQRDRGREFGSSGLGRMRRDRCRHPARPLRQRAAGTTSP